MRFFLNKSTPIVYMVKEGTIYSAYTDVEDTWLRVSVSLDILEQHVREGLMEEIQYEESFHQYDS